MATDCEQVGINLGDPIFQGVYRGKQAHPDDQSDVIKRAVDVGCTKMMITGSNLVESKHAVDIAKQYRMSHGRLTEPAC